MLREGELACVRVRAVQLRCHISEQEVSDFAQPLRTEALVLLEFPQQQRPNRPFHLEQLVADLFAKPRE